MPRPTRRWAGSSPPVPERCASSPSRPRTTSPRPSSPRSTRACTWSRTPCASSPRRAGGCSSTAEHFFDGWQEDAAYGRRVLEAAARAGAEVLVLCDTNGGTLSHEAEQIVASVVEFVDALDLDLSDGRPRPRVGLHFHNDSGVAVANTLAGVRVGATHVQGCINGYGERTGNANLTTIIADLELKMGVRALPEGRLERLTVGRPPRGRAGQRGARSAGTVRRVVGFRPQGRACTCPPSPDAPTPTNTCAPTPSATAPGSWSASWPGSRRSQMKAAQLGLDIDSDVLTHVLEQLKELEHRGYHFEAADGSLELLLRAATGWKQPWFAVESFRVITESRGPRWSWRPPSRCRWATSGCWPWPRATARSTPSTVRCARRWAPPTRSCRRFTSPTTGCGSSTPRPGTGAVTRVLIDSTDGDPHMVDDRSVRQHHRSLVAGPLRVDRLRPPVQPSIASPHGPA